MKNCNACSIPPIDIVQQSVDLDSPNMIPVGIAKVDCFIYYKNQGSYIMECKTSYIKKAIKQFEICITYLRSNWDEFIKRANLPNTTPKPENFILLLANGIGKERLQYEIELKTKKLKIRKNGYQKINNSGSIVVYTKTDIKNMKTNLERSW